MSSIWCGCPIISSETQGPSTFLYPFSWSPHEHKITAGAPVFTSVFEKEEDREKNKKALISWVRSLLRAFFHLTVVQLLSCVWLFATPRTATHEASLSFTISPSLLKLMAIESAMPSNHLILCCLILCLPSIFPSIRVFSNESGQEHRKM